MNALRQKVLNNWIPLWDEFLETDAPRSVICNSQEDARNLRNLYYRAKKYCREQPELYERYRKTLLEWTVCVEGCVVVFRKHSKLYLEELLK